MEIPQTRLKDEGNARLTPPVGDTVDGMLGCYVDWREAAHTVGEAYRRWSGAPDGEEAGRFSAYLGALDQEECSARSYAVAVARVAALLDATTAP